VPSHTGLRRRWSCWHGSTPLSMSRPSWASEGRFCEAPATGHAERWPVAGGTALFWSLLSSRPAWPTRLCLQRGYQMKKAHDWLPILY
jgi:hypothetical protein